MKNTILSRTCFQLLAFTAITIATTFPSVSVSAQERSQYDLAAWMNAAQYDNDTASVNWALKEGLHIDYRRGWGNGLHLAIFHKRPMMVKFLLGKGASVDALTEEGLTALQLAEKIGNQEIIDLIKNKKGIKTTTKNNSANSPTPAADTKAEGLKVKGALYSEGQKVLFSPDRGKRWERGIVVKVSNDPLLTTNGIPVYHIENLEKSISGYYDVCYVTTLERQPSWTSFFVGDWDLYLPMAVTERVIGRDVYQVYSGADRLPPLRIGADNTFSWVVDKKKVIRGKWKPNSNAPGIVLLKADGGTDWYIYSNADGISNKIHKTDQVRLVSEPNGTPRHGFRIKNK